jgi:hypothetical protein
MATTAIATAASASAAVGFRTQRKKKWVGVGYTTVRSISTGERDGSFIFIRQQHQHTARCAVDCPIFLLPFSFPNIHTNTYMFINLK